MSLEIKIKILVTLFGIKSFLHLLDGVGAISNGATYGEYGDALVSAAIFAYLAYVVYVLPYSAACRGAPFNNRPFT